MSTDAHTTTDPATNGTASPAPREELMVTGRTLDELARDLVELEQQFEPPEPGSVLADARWLESHWGTPQLAPYRGTHVAVLNGAVVGHGANALQLQLDTARKFGIHPQRIVVEYIPPNDF